MNFFVWIAISALLGLLGTSGCTTAPKTASEPAPIQPPQAVPQFKSVRSGEIEIRSTPAVSDEALERTRWVIDRMLRNAPEVRRSMEKKGFVVEVIAKDQKVTDLERYAHLKDKKTFDGRDFDAGTRGLGDLDAASVGEENVLCLPGQRYYEEDILVHEFSHSVMFHLDATLREAIETAYSRAKEKKLFPKESYMMADAQEYWAEATQAWFNVTARKDVNGGYNTRDKIRSRDLALSALLQEVYGDTQIPHYKDCIY